MKYIGKFKGVCYQTVVFCNNSLENVKMSPKKVTNSTRNQVISTTDG